MKAAAASKMSSGPSAADSRGTASESFADGGAPSESAHVRIFSGGCHPGSASSSVPTASARAWSGFSSFGTRMARAARLDALPPSEDPYVACDVPIDAV